MGTNENVIAYSMHGAMIGRKDTAGPMGSGFFEANEPSYTLTASSQARHGVVIVFYANRVADIRLQDDKINTLQARMGTGGNNMPMVAYPIQDGREMEKKQNGLGIGNENDPSYTLDRTGGQAMATETQVRRLTPLECERLQGFPDGWTADQVDTHRYKQMGNAVAVPVVEWIIQGITDSI